MHASTYPFVRGSFEKGEELSMFSYAWEDAHKGWVIVQLTLKKKKKKKREGATLIIVKHHKKPLMAKYGI